MEPCQDNKYVVIESDKQVTLQYYLHVIRDRLTKDIRILCSSDMLKKISVYSIIIAKRLFLNILVSSKESARYTEGFLSVLYALW